MADPGIHPLEVILLQCAKAAPQPWYPSAFARAAGIPREDLDPHLDRLRMGGLVRLTDWVEGQGQGYELTPEGVQVVKDPRLLRRLRNGQVPLVTGGPQPLLSADDGPPNAWERGEEVRAALLTPVSPVITYALLYINVAVFLAGLILAYRNNVDPKEFLFPSTEKALQIIHQTGAMSGPDVYVRHQWWRLLTCCFVHIGLVHLGVNMFSLYAVGPFLERMWGRWRYLVLYLLCGVCGSCGMLLESVVTSAPFVGAGASGALWGVLASMVTWLLLHRQDLPGPWVSSTLGRLGFVFLLNAVLTFGVAGISKGAHFGGGAIGLIAAIPLDLLHFGRKGQRWLALAALVALPLLCVGMVWYSFATGAGKRLTRAESGDEIAELNQHYLPKIQEAATRANDVYDKEVKPLLQEPPERRDAADVQKAVSDGDEARTALTQVVSLLDRAGPFYSPAAREAQGRGEVYVQAWAKLLELAGACLGPGDQGKEKEEELKDQEKQLQEARQRWEKLLE